MCSSVRGHEVLKGVPLLAGVIYGDEAEAGLMQMDLNTEPCDARGENSLRKCKKSTWWCVHGAAGSFSSLVHSPRKKHKELRVYPSCGPLGVGAEVWGAQAVLRAWVWAGLSWDWSSSRSSESDASPGAASHTAQFGVQGFLGPGEGGNLLWDIFIPPGCSATELTWNRALEQRYVLSDF